ncbi:ParB/RepB/Spo0J family partition protein [Pseudomonas corrugata]|uniref:ParB/RepB/Spo0J family partition protein n=1 Tax=Pseudomonas corrugata TaxID=47879 RepID=UPI0018E6411A|nr:ParB/RepB/Spo0J family partition protein [Pseudomonas corrugata]MBI6621551.1 ParB/RepB/Spo0J family partition protein [Pseudomonas corrugata]MBI6694214.1 ParB/RepB/Spo0J family partition protein [Pseudomonas corrugata]
MTTKNAKKDAATEAKDAPKGSAFAGLSDMLGNGGLTGMTDMNGHLVVDLDLNEIAVKGQDREIFEDDDQTIESLWKSIKQNGLMQAIIVRPVEGPLPYELVIGERRVRSFKFGGASTIPARVLELTDEQAEAMQSAENIDRLNLTMIEEAKKIERDLAKHGGDIEKLMAESNKSRSWISKRLAILTLPDAAARVIRESVSADLEVIHNVAQVAKVNPAAAEELVDELKETAGKPGSNARKTSQAAKDKAKGPTKAATKKAAEAAKGGKGGEQNKAPDAKGAPGSNLGGMQADLAALDGLLSGGAQAQPQGAGAGIGSGFVDSAASGDDEPGHQLNEEDVPALAPQKELGEIYEDIFEHNNEPKELLKNMLPSTREVCENWLHSIYDAGTQAKDLSRTVMLGFRSGQFATEGHGALTLAAFLYGADSNAKFNLQNVLASIKA